MAQNRKTAGNKTSSAVSASKGSKKSFYLVLAVAGIAGIALLSYLASQSSAGKIITLDPNLPPITSEGYVMGSPTAPLELIEFGDFECPGCAQYSELAEPEIREKYINTGKIRFRFIDLPLNIHRNTLNAHHAAACAAEQGKFWEMHDLLFSTQDSWNAIATSNPDKFIKTLVPRIPGLDAAKWDECHTSRRLQGKVQAHLKIATDRGVTGTPTFVLGNKEFGLLRGDQAGQMGRIIDEALAALPATTKKP
jgi:protein-disulfide isomerase